MTNLLETCTDCFEITLPECSETIKMQAGLVANAYYWYQLENRFGQKFTDRLQTDENGNLVLDLTRFANHQALFSHTAGTFTLSVGNYLPSCGETTLQLCGQEYGCVKITFERVFNVSDEMLLAYIPCGCAEESDGDGEGENPPPPPPPSGINLYLDSEPTGNGITEYQFNDQTLGEPSSTVSFRIYSTDMSPLVFTGDPDSIVFSGDVSDFTLLSEMPTGSLPWGEYVVMDIGFTPQGIGKRAATLLIFSNAANQNPRYLYLAGNGI